MYIYAYTHSYNRNNLNIHEEIFYLENENKAVGSPKNDYFEYNPHSFL